MYTKHKWGSDRYYNFGYVVNLPKDYDPEKKYPLVFFLHGAGERGDDLDVAMRHGYMKHVREEGAEYPFLFVAPQCPDDKYWGCYTESLTAFLDFICETYPVDKERMYLTGLSMGGTGTWMFAMANPDRFAAIAPICGSGIYWNTGIIKDLPVHMVHGDCDDVVPVSNSVEMLTSMYKHGGTKAELTIRYGAGHNVWDYAYEGDWLFRWLMQHKKEK